MPESAVAEAEVVDGAASPEAVHVTEDGMTIDTTSGEVLSEEPPARGGAIVRHGGGGTLSSGLPGMAMTISEAREQVRLLQEFVRGEMVEGEDYGIIPGTAKPTLFKPGAEKLNGLFGLAPVVEVLQRVEDYAGTVYGKPFVSYEVKVTLLDKRTNHIVAEGVGQCNSWEKRYASQSAANIANTILKMSKKRALVDATLSATRVSGLFTQDLEDGFDAGRSDGRAESRGDSRAAARPSGPSRPAPARTGPPPGAGGPARSGPGAGGAGPGGARPGGPVPRCPQCAGEMYDNRGKKASGEYGANTPDFRCKNRDCVDGSGHTTAIWQDGRGSSGGGGSSSGARRPLPMDEFPDYDDSDPFSE